MSLFAVYVIYKNNIFLLFDKKNVLLHPFPNLEKYMNFLDFVIALPIGYLIFKGYRRGLIFEVASLVGIIIGSIAAVRMAHWFASLVGLNGDHAFLISFFVIFVGVVLLSMFLGKLVERFVKLVHVGFANNLAGAILGFAKGLCIVGVLLYFVTFIDFKEKILTCDAKQTSMLYRPVEQTGQHLVGRMEVYIQNRKNTMNSSLQ